MRKFHIPTKNEVPEHDRKIFYILESSIGFVPNIYAFMSHSETALGSFLRFSETSVVFCEQEALIIQLITSQLNTSQYSLSMFSAIARKAGLTDGQIIEIRKGNVSFEGKWDALAKFTCEMVSKRGEISPEVTERFYGAGYTDRHLVDLVMIVSRTVAIDYINVATRNPVDFPEVPVIICNCDCGK